MIQLTNSSDPPHAVHPRDNTTWLSALVVATASFAVAAPPNVFLPVLDRPTLNPRFAEYEALDLEGMSTGDVLARQEGEAIQWRDVSGPKTP